MKSQYQAMNENNFPPFEDIRESLEEDILRELPCNLAWCKEEYENVIDS